MVVSGQLHAPGALPPRREAPVPTGQGAGWVPEQVRILWRRGNLLPFSGNRNPAVQIEPVVIPTELSGCAVRWNISSPSSFTACFMLVPCLACRHVPPKRWLTFNWLHGIISQKTELSVTTSDLTYSLLTNRHFRSQMFHQMHRSGDPLNETDWHMTDLKCRDCWSKFCIFIQRRTATECRLAGL
jgi:ribosomal protein S27E